jgi:hypothetical protein
MFRVLRFERVRGTSGDDRRDDLGRKAKSGRVKDGPGLAA